MDDAAKNPFGSAVEFPTIPREKIPDSTVALSHILAGQRALREFYARLEGLLKGECHCLAVLLKRDWERRFGELLFTGEELLRTLERSEDEPPMLPSEEQILSLVGGLEDSSPAKVLETTKTFVYRALLCYQMVPWVSEIKEVFDFFRSSVEAEDSHMAFLDLIGDLIPPCS